MAHVKSVYKHISLINICVTQEVSSLVLKSLFKDRGLDRHIRSKCLYHVIDRGMALSFVSIRRRCLFTARSRGLISNLYLGRNVFKKLASGGKLVGYIKV
jgi:ribosomal protein S14